VYTITGLVATRIDGIAFQVKDNAVAAEFLIP
jgi:hypothetical protein